MQYEVKKVKCGRVFHMCCVRNVKRPYLLTEEIVLDVTNMHTVNASARIFVFSHLSSLLVFVMIN